MMILDRTILWYATERKCGDLSLYVYQGGRLIFARSGYEKRYGMLTEAIRELCFGLGDPREWDDNMAHCGKYADARSPARLVRGIGDDALIVASGQVDFGKRVASASINTYALGASGRIEFGYSI